MRIAHQNIQSISSPKQPRGQAVINFIETSLTPPAERIDIMILTETWVKQQRHLQAWIQFSSVGREYDIITCHETSRNDNASGQGVAIIIHKNWTPFIRAIYKIPGRLVLLKLARLAEIITLGAVYYPSNPDSESTKETVKKMEKLLSERLKANNKKEQEFY